MLLKKITEFHALSAVGIKVHIIILQKSRICPSEKPVYHPACRIKHMRMETATRKLSVCHKLL